MNHELSFLKNKKIAILGWGMENRALLKHILKHKIKCEITVCDKRNDINKQGMINKRISWQLGKNYNKNLEKFDILFRAPGWPIKSLKRPGLSGVLTSPMKLFFELCPTKNIVGVTGAKGKGTTASLIYEILKTAGRRVWLGGNIGVAPFEFMDKIKKSDWLVLELSSFQLEDFNISPRIAVITNFYPEHLAPADPDNPNFHKSAQEYWRAKANIFRWQKRGDYLIIKSQILNLKQIPNSKSQNTKIVYFSKSDLPSRLIGEHNKENIAAAVAAAKIVGVKSANIKKAVASFKGLEHRLELARKYRGVKYYNDSFATTPETAIIALKSFKEPAVILLGGADKGADFKRLAQEIKKRCKFVILLNGRATGRIKQELVKAGFLKDKIKLFNDINEAVKTAGKISVRGDIVLLSTACASFGMFKNYKERGKLFKAAVRKLGRPG